MRSCMPACVHVPALYMCISTTLNYNTIARTSYSVMMVAEIPGITNCFRPKLLPATIHSWTSANL